MGHRRLAGQTDRNDGGSRPLMVAQVSKKEGLQEGPVDSDTVTGICHVAGRGWEDQRVQSISSRSLNLVSNPGIQHGCKRAGGRPCTPLPPVHAVLRQAVNITCMRKLYRGLRLSSTSLAILFKAPVGPRSRVRLLVP